MPSELRCSARGRSCAALTAVALTDATGLRVALSHNDGGAARTAALGGVLVIAGVAAACRDADRRRVEVAGAQNRFVSR